MQGRLLAGPAVAQAAASRGREGFLTGFYDQCSKGNAFREEKVGLSGCTQLRPANPFCGFVFPDAPLLPNPSPLLLLVAGDCFSQPVDFKA